MQITGATPVKWSEVWADGLTLVNVDDRIVPGYRALAKAVHDEGGLMLAQLAHVGAMETSGDAIISASWTRSELTQQMSREASAEELAEVLALYEAAALRCREGGLDGIEVTMAHGMLLASFLSPLMNRREDEYGGDLDGRTLYPRRVLAAVREAMGEDSIVGIRIPGDELVEDGGIGPEEAGRIAARLVATGVVDYVSVTAGNNTRKLARVDHWPPTPAPLGAFRHLSRSVKQAVDVPVATVGRVTSLDLAEEILAAGDADLVGMVRANIADANLLPKAVAGKPGTIRPCIGANVCINSLLDHRPLTCMVNPELGRPLGTIDQPIGAARSAVVVGAGPAGLEAARRLALRGYRTTLIERDEDIGGQLSRWARTPSREEFLKIVQWWGDELDRLGVDLRLGEEASASGLAALQPSVTLLATGSRPIVAAFDGGAAVLRPLRRAAQRRARAGSRRDGPAARHADGGAAGPRLEEGDAGDLRHAPRRRRGHHDGLLPASGACRAGRRDHRPRQARRASKERRPCCRGCSASPAGRSGRSTPSSPCSARPARMRFPAR